MPLSAREEFDPLVQEVCAWSILPWSRVLVSLLTNSVSFPRHSISFETAPSGRVLSRWWFEHINRQALCSKRRTGHTLRSYSWLCLYVLSIFLDARSFITHATSFLLFKQRCRTELWRFGRFPPPINPYTVLTRIIYYQRARHHGPADCTYRRSYCDCHGSSIWDHRLGWGVPAFASLWWCPGHRLASSYALILTECQWKYGGD